MRIITLFWIISVLGFANCAARVESPFQIRTGSVPSVSEGVPVLLASYSDRCEELSRKRIWYWPWLFPINSREIPGDAARAYRFKTVMTKSDIAISIPGFLIGLATQTDVVETCDTKFVLKNRDSSMERQVALDEKPVEKSVQTPVQAPIVGVAASSLDFEFSELKLSAAADANVILFEMDDDRISQTELQKLQLIFAKLPHDDSIKLIIMGHADLTGERLNNVMLSWKRAIAVARALEGLGQPRNRMLLLAAGPDWPANSLQNQRRVEIILAR